MKLTWQQGVYWLCCFLLKHFTSIFVVGLSLFQFGLNTVFNSNTMIFLSSHLGKEFLVFSGGGSLEKEV